MHDGLELVDFQGEIGTSPDCLLAEKGLFQVVDFALTLKRHEHLFSCFSVIELIP